MLERAAEDMSVGDVARATRSNPYAHLLSPTFIERIYLATADQSRQSR